MTDTVRSQSSASRARFSAVAAMIAVMALIGTIALFLVNAARHEAEARTQAQQTASVIQELAAALEAALQAETGQRGYLLTRRRSYLDPYYEGAEAWPRHLDRVAALLGEDAGTVQRHDLERLRALSEAKLTELALTVRKALEGNRKEALAIVLSDEGKTLMGNYRDVTSRLIAAETRSLDAAFARAAGADARNLPLMLSLLGLTIALFVTVLVLERHVRRVRTLVAAHQQALLVSRELNHRVKNIFAVIGSMIGLAGRSGEDTATTLAALRERLHALSVAHDLTSGAVSDPSVSLQAIVDATLAPYRDSARPIAVHGDRIDLAASAVTPLGLILHELATNAVKYGALAREDGRLDVEWKRDTAGGGETLRLFWRESSAINGFRKPDREGFGTMMMSMSAQQLDGRIERRFSSGGLETILEIPLDGVRR